MSQQDPSYKHQWYLKHRDEIRQKKKQQKLENPEEGRERNHRSYVANREKRLAQQKTYVASHRQERAATSRAYRLANAETISQKRKAKYQANREQHLERNRVNYQKHREQRQVQNRTWAKANPEQVRLIKQRYRDSHREELRAKGRTYQKKRWTENSEELRRRQRAYYAATYPARIAYARAYVAQHREIFNERQRLDRARHPEYDKAWRKAHPEVSRLKQSRRLARKRGLPDTFAAEQRVFMLDYWHHACAVCGNQEGLFWTLADDHWVPLSSSSSPGTVSTNMVPLCHTTKLGHPSCNLSKSDNDPKAWLLSRYTPAQTKRILKAIETYFAVVRARNLPPEAP